MDGSWDGQIHPTEGCATPPRHSRQPVLWPLAVMQGEIEGRPWPGPLSLTIKRSPTGQHIAPHSDTQDAAMGHSPVEATMFRKGHPAA